YKYGDMIIRHLVLPGHVECCTKPVLRWISENCPRTLTNIMDQYRPEHLVALYAEKYHEIARRPSASELEEVYGFADKLGICWRPVS
ncbi:MAG: pyruvate formate lyase-activating protein, partial [Thermofilaceae archaeon]